MVDLRDYMHPDLSAGREVGIEVKLMLWLNAGSGRIEALEPRLLALQGIIQVLGKERPIELQLAKHLVTFTDESQGKRKPKGHDCNRADAHRSL